MKIVKVRAISALLSCVVLAVPSFASDVYIDIKSNTSEKGSALVETKVETIRPIETYADLGEVLNQNSSVVVKNSGDGRLQNIFINGMADGVVVIIDGVRAPQDASGRTDLSNIDINSIASIKVLEGPQYEYGPSASAGVILITTKQPAKGVHKGNFNIGIGSLRTQEAALDLTGNITDKLNYSLNSSYKASNGFQENAEWNKQSINASLFYQLAENSKVGINLGYLHGDWNLPGGTNVPYNEWNGHKEKTPLTPDDWFTQNLLTASAIYNSSKLEALVGYSELTYKQKAQNPNKYHSVNGGIKYIGIENLKVGADFTTSFASEAASWLGDYGKKHQNTIGLFSTYVFNLGPASFNPSIRYDYDNMYYGVLTGGLLTKLNLAEKSFLFVNIARGSRTPTMQDRPFASDKLNREYSNNYEIGSQTYVLNSIIGASAFIIDYKDRITSDPNTWEMVNAGNSRSKGIKAYANTIVGLLDNNFNITLTKALDDQKVRKTHTPMTQISNQTSLKFGSFRLYHSLDYTKMSNTGTGVEKWDWLDLGAGIEYRFGGQASLTAGVSNYLNEHYSRNILDSFNGFVGYPEPGRTFKAGLKYNFWN